MKLHHLPLFLATALGLGLAACVDTNTDTDKTGDTGGVTDTTDTTGTTATTGNTSETGTEPPCGNGTLDKGEDCDGTELGGNTCADVDTFVDGTLACDKSCAFDTTQCITASSWIADARAAADGKVSLPIAKAIVSNVRPLIGSDPAGFFVQAEMAGPALFVSVDPASLKPAPAVGDIVSFTITEMSTLFGLRHASAIDTFAVDGNVSNVASLLQNLTASSSVVKDLDALEAELVSFDAEIIGDFGFAGSGNVSAQISTSGYPKGDPDLLLRMSSDLLNESDLDNGCVLSFQGNMWRFNTDAQPSVYDAGDLTITSCPAPTVVSATATAADTVVVSFDRLIDAATADVGDFTFDNGLTATAVAAVTDRTVTITTSSQTGGVKYTVTVSGVDDTLGATVSTKANTATFTGFETFDAQLYITEVDADTAGTDALEFVEVWNNTGATVDLAKEGIFVLFINGNGDITYATHALSGSLKAGDVHVLGNSGVADVDTTFADNTLQNGADGVLLVACPDCTGAGDIANGTDPTTKGTFTSGSGATVTKLDGVAYDTNDGDDKGLWAVLGTNAQYNEDENGAKDTESVYRATVTAFQVGKPSPGTP